MDLPVNLVSDAVDLLATGPPAGLELGDARGGAAGLLSQLQERWGQPLSSARRVSLLECLGAHPSVRVAALQPLHLAATPAAVEAARMWRGPAHCSMTSARRSSP